MKIPEISEIIEMDTNFIDMCQKLAMNESITRVTALKAFLLELSNSMRLYVDLLETLKSEDVNEQVFEDFRDAWGSYNGTKESLNVLNEA